MIKGSLRAWLLRRARALERDRRWGEETVAWLKQMREMPEAPEIEQLRRLQRSRPMPGKGNRA